VTTKYSSDHLVNQERERKENKAKQSQEEIIIESYFKSCRSDPLWKKSDRPRPAAGVTPRPMISLLS
jgi:hypothetical protein